MKNFKLDRVIVKPDKVTIRSQVDLLISFKIDMFLPYNSILSLLFRGGRNNKNDWYYLQPFDKKQPGFIEIRVVPFIKIIPLQITGKEFIVKYIICNKEGMSKGTMIQFTIKNTLVQSIVEENKKFDVLIQTPNNDLFVADNPPTIDVINEVFDHITIICPSIVKEGELFKILVRVEDNNGNLVGNFSDEVQLIPLEQSNPINNVKTIKFTENHKGLTFESGFSFPKPGIYYIKALYKGEHFQSNPILCVGKNCKNKLYWGYIHGHTNKSDGVRNPETYFSNLINAGLNFGTSTEHDHQWETSDGDFEEVKRICQKFNSSEFVTIFGYEWGSWYTGGNGDICIYFTDPKLPILRSDINKYNSTEKLIKNLIPIKEKVLLVSHHTALRPGYRNWDYFDNCLERLVEIYSTWGNQEYSSNEGNPLPPRYKFFGEGKFAPKKGPIIEKHGSFVNDALLRGYKLGFTAGGDDHIGLYPSGPFNPENGIYPSGIMAVWAPNLNRESIWNALINRKCYGTTGPRVIIEFRVNDFYMGDIIDSETNPTVLEHRIINLSLISPLNIEKVEIIRNNKTYSSQRINSKSFETKIKDLDPFQEISLLHQDKKENFLFYYPRIYLENCNMAWASPIWVTKKK